MAPLDVDDDRQRRLASALEGSARALAAIRYGSAFRLGPAHVVLNPAA